MKFKIGQEVTQIGYQKIWKVQSNQTLHTAGTIYLIHDDDGNRSVESENQLRALENNPIIRKVRL